MKKSRSEVEERRRKILALVSEQGRVEVALLAEEFQVSLLTVRRDLQVLEDEQYLVRYYGGAGRGPMLSEELVKNERDLSRESIAKYAASLVEAGDSIFINTSSTALRMVKYIKQNVTVITNNGNIINMETPANVTVVLTGGELRYKKGAMVGDFALSSLLRVTAKKSFIGCGGLSADMGMTTEMLNEVNINQAMFERISGRAYILADSTKIGKYRSFVSCPMAHITDIITDFGASQEEVDKFRNRGIIIHQVS